MPGHESRAQRPPGVTGGGLNPDAIENLFAKDFAVGDTVQRHAAGENQIAFAGLLARMFGHAIENLLCDFLIERAMSMSRCVSFDSGLRAGPPNRSANL